MFYVMGLDARLTGQQLVLAVYEGLEIVALFSAIVAVRWFPIHACGNSLLGAGKLLLF